MPQGDSEARRRRGRRPRVHAAAGRLLGTRADRRAGRRPRGARTSTSWSTTAARSAGLRPPSHTDEDFDYVLDVNLRTAFVLSREVGRRMIARGPARSSTPRRCSASRVASTSRVHGLEVGRRGPDQGPGQRVGAPWASTSTRWPPATSPPPTPRPAPDTERSQAILDRIPAGRWAQAADIAGAVAVPLLARRRLRPRHHPSRRRRLAGPVTATRIVITECDHDSFAAEREITDAAGAELVLTQSRDVRRADRERRRRRRGPRAVRPDHRRGDGRPARLRAIGRYGVGVDSVDVAAATARGIAVCNVPDYGTESVSDHAIGLTLAAARGIPRLDRGLRAGSFDLAAVRPLFQTRGRVFGVVGMGRIGTATARKAAGLGLRGDRLRHRCPRRRDELPRVHLRQPRRAAGAIAGRLAAHAAHRADPRHDRRRRSSRGCGPTPSW